MAFRVKCPCGTVVVVSPKRAGKMARCPKCRNTFRIPSGAAVGKPGASQELAASPMPPAPPGADVEFPPPDELGTSMLMGDDAEDARSQAGDVGVTRELASADALADAPPEDTQMRVDALVKESSTGKDVVSKRGSARKRESAGRGARDRRRKPRVCPECGAALSPRDSKCPGCGAAVAAGKPEGKWLLPAVIGGSIVVIVVGVLLKGRSDENVEPKVEDNPPVVEETPVNVVVEPVTQKPDPDAEAMNAAQAIEGLLAREQFEKALGEANAAAARFAGTKHEGTFRALAERADRKIKDKLAAARFERDLARIGELRGRGDLKGALAFAQEALKRTESPAQREQIDDLVFDIAAEIERAEAQRVAAEHQAEVARLLAEGNAALARADFDAAEAAYTSASRLGADVDGKMAEVRFARFVAGAEAAERDGRLEDAIASYRKALDVRRDDAIASRIRQLERRIELDGSLARVVTAIDSGQFDEGRRLLAAFTQGLRTGEEAYAERARVLAADIEAAEQCSKLVEQAEAEGKAGRWPAAYKLASEAIKVRPKDEAAKRIYTRARDMMRNPTREIDNSIGMKLRLVPAGSTDMGNEEGDADERPVHTVKLDAFYIGKFEVTNAEFEKFRPEHKARRASSSGGDDYPAVNVSWADAVAFCEWLSKTDGMAYRLPTEAEWERAALSRGRSMYPWGDDLNARARTAKANYYAGPRTAWRRDGYRFAAPVGSMPEGASPFGAFDMAGNVEEWCADWYDPAYYSKSPGENPTGPESGSHRVVRGGSWQTPAPGLRSTRRGHYPEGTVSETIGFRVVRVVFPE